MPTREDQKKPDEEMLIVHKHGPQADPKKAGGPAPALPRAASLDKQELELMKKQLGMSKDPGVRRELMSQIQMKFGNDKAVEVARETRLQLPDDDLRARSGGATGAKKGKT